MSDYKNTLNLPQTDFPMKANLSVREVEFLKKWQSEKLYQQLREQNKKKKRFVLHLGPPYANGHIHLGTATTTILKDIIVKAKTMSGFDSPLVPGWDCHGLPIELNVEKKIGKPGAKVSATEFRKACKDYAFSFIDIQREEFIRLGIIADWQNPYMTMDPVYEANIIRSLAKIIKRGHVQKGFKPVHWCLDCGSALAEAEVEYAEKTSPSIDVRFVVKDNADLQKHLSEKISLNLPAAIPIWTTTPWTLPANEAVALHPELEYVIVAGAEDYVYIVAKDLLSSVLTRYGIKEHRILATVKGATLEGIVLKHPFYEKEVPVVLGEHVTVETGTGAVHTAPAHGQDDYVIGKKYHLPVENPVGDDGCFTVSTPLFAGIHVNKANEKIIATLKEHNTLIVQDTLRHSYPHCWRHKTALIFRATPQWFISMEKKGLREMALAAIKKVEWIPEWGQPRITAMIENRPDWCISRQRAWGVPIALFVHKDTGEMHPDTQEIMEKVAKLVEKDGIEAWYQVDAKSLVVKDAENYRKTNDVLDVWFDSGVSHECVLRKRPELHFPADIVLEGSDQHRGWFQTSLLTSIAMNDEASFKAVLTHGFVVDGQGRKMSKSLGNVIAPEEVIKTLGADILRLWVGSIDYRNEISASKEILNRMTESYRRIRNTARFMLANLHDFDPKVHLLKDEDMLPLDRYAVSLAHQLQQEITDAYDAYQFHLVIQKLQNFCITDMGGFYLDIIKDRQYTMAKETRGRRSAQTALYHLVHALSRWLAPILSFTAEEIYQFIPGEKQSSVFMTTWYEGLKANTNDKMDEAFWQKIRSVRDAVNKEIENLRNQNKLGGALEAEVTLYCGAQLKQQLDLFKDELRFVLITSYATVIADQNAPLDAVVTDVPGLRLKIKATIHPKCERCWQRREDVDSNKDYPGLCSRCVENVAGKGEVREYA